MLTTIDTETAICKYLNEFLFDHVWNLPEAEYRQNIVAKCIASSPKVNRIDLGLTSISLPDNSPYLVYSVPKTYLEGIKVDVSAWTKLLTFVNERPLDFRVTGYNGEWLYRDKIYIIDHPCEDSFILAIDYNMAKKILNSDATSNYNFKKIYFSVYYDSDRGESVYYDCIRPINLSQRNEAWNKCQLAQLVIINGREAVPTSVNDICTGDYVEFMDDPDVVADFTINLNDADQNRVFKSSLISEFKYIIHIPKKYNPNNYLLTHNTCDVFIRPNSISNAHLKGTFIHRFNTKQLITQITHNDFAIAESLIQQYMTFLKSTEVTLRVMVRCHMKKKRTISGDDVGESILIQDSAYNASTIKLTDANIDTYKGTEQMVYNHPRTLVRESNYIDMLYQLTDDEILDFLEGKGSDELSFWKASNLEASKYTNMMFSNPIYINRNNMDEYVPILGYYNTMSVLCKRVTRTTLCLGNTNTFTVDVPLSLIKVKKVFANVFLNGTKLDYSKYSTLKYGQYLTITVDESIDLEAGDEIVTEIFEKPDAYGEYFIPTSDNNEFDVSEDCIVFLTNELGAEDSVIRNNNYFTEQYDLNMSYQDVTANEEVCTKSDTKIIFNANYYGKTFFICSKYVFANPYNLQFDIADLNNKSMSTGVLNLTYTSWDGENTITAPLLQDITPVVFLNGRELVNNVDYSLNVNKDIYGNVTCKTIHISNAEYLNNLKKSIVNYIIVTKGGMTNLRGQYKLVDATVDGINRVWTNPDTNLSIYYTNNRWVIGDSKSAALGYFVQTDQTTNRDPVECDWNLGSRGSGTVPALTRYYETYETRDDNYLEVLVTTDKCFAEENGFVINNACNSLNILMYWYPGLAMFTTDGHAIKDLEFSDGYLKIDPTETREGAIYNMRAMAPVWIRTLLDQYCDSDEDIQRCSFIIDFFRSRIVEEDNYTVIPNSHHIYSIVMNEIIKDVLAKTTTLVYDADLEKMLLQVEKYLTVKTQDPALSGVLGSINVLGAGISYVNANYTLIDNTSTGSARIWMSSNSTVLMKWSDGKWIIVKNYVTNPSILYYADDTDGDHDPWTLTWQTNDTEDKAPTMYSGNLNLKFVDILPSYRVNEVYDAATYLALKQLQKALLPADAVKDVINAQE